MRLKEAMKESKRTGKKQRVDEPERVADVKVSVTIRFDLEVLKKIKAEAESKAIPYQTLINSILKQHADGDPIETRLERIEKELFKKRA